MDALVEKLVQIQRKMVLDYRFEFRDKLVQKLRDLDQSLFKMDKACETDQQR